MMSEPIAFKSWAIVEVMGHQRYAGYVQEQTIGGNSFVRVDVPEVPGHNGYEAGLPAFTKLFTQGAIFCITPTTEDTARRAAKAMRSQPSVCLYELEPRMQHRAIDFHSEQLEAVNG